MTEPSTPRGLSLQVDENKPQTQAVLKALASEPRLRILDLLRNNIYNVSEIADALDFPLSTANLHINILEEAGLLLTEHKPATRGSQRVCARVYDTILIQLPLNQQETQQLIELSMPVGGYVDAQVTPFCGLASETGIIGLFDDPSSFYEPERVQAQLLWFHHGHVEYRFPNRLPPNITPDSIHLSMEICSEAPLHHDNWPSDVTVWINDVEVGSWTSPADFGGQRGKLTPAWWENHNSQYGLLKIWQVNREGSYVDGLKISAVKIDDLAVANSKFISVRIGVKENARHVGGLNLFGRTFGNYPQDIVLRLKYT